MRLNTAGIVLPATTAVVGFGIYVSFAILMNGAFVAIGFEPWSEARTNFLWSVGSLVVSVVGYTIYDLSRLRLRNTGTMDAFPIVTERKLKIGGGILALAGFVALGWAGGDRGIDFNSVFEESVIAVSDVLGEPDGETGPEGDDCERHARWAIDEGHSVEVALDGIEAVAISVTGGGLLPRKEEELQRRRLTGYSGLFSDLAGRQCS